MTVTDVQDAVTGDPTISFVSNLSVDSITIDVTALHDACTAAAATPLHLTVGITEFNVDANGDIVVDSELYQQSTFTSETIKQTAVRTFELTSIAQQTEYIAGDSFIRNSAFGGFVSSVSKRYIVRLELYDTDMNVYAGTVKVLSQEEWIFPSMATPSFTTVGLVDHLAFEITNLNVTGTVADTYAVNELSISLQDRQDKNRTIDRVFYKLNTGDSTWYATTDEKSVTNDGDATVALLSSYAAASQGYVAAAGAPALQSLTNVTNGVAGTIGLYNANTDTYGLANYHKYAITLSFGSTELGPGDATIVDEHTTKALEPLTNVVTTNVGSAADEVDGPTYTITFSIPNVDNFFSPSATTPKPDYPTYIRLYRGTETANGSDVWSWPELGNFDREIAIADLTAVNVGNLSYDTYSFKDYSMGDYTLNYLDYVYPKVTYVRALKGTGLESDEVDGVSDDVVESEMSSAADGSLRVQEPAADLKVGIIRHSLAADTEEIATRFQLPADWTEDLQEQTYGAGNIVLSYSEPLWGDMPYYGRYNWPFRQNTMNIYAPPSGVTNHPQLLDYYQNNSGVACYGGSADAVPTNRTVTRTIYSFDSEHNLVTGTQSITYSKNPDPNYYGGGLGSMEQIWVQSASQYSGTPFEFASAYFNWYNGGPIGRALMIALINEVARAPLDALNTCRFVLLGSNRSYTFDLAGLGTDTFLNEEQTTWTLYVRADNGFYGNGARLVLTIAEVEEEWKQFIPTKDNGTKFASIRSGDVLGEINIDMHNVRLGAAGASYTETDDNQHGDGNRTYYQTNVNSSYRIGGINAQSLNYKVTKTYGGTSTVYRPVFGSTEETHKFVNMDSFLQFPEWNNPMVSSFRPDNFAFFSTSAAGELQLWTNNAFIPSEGQKNFMRIRWTDQADGELLDEAIDSTNSQYALTGINAGEAYRPKVQIYMDNAFWADATITDEYENGQYDSASDTSFGNELRHFTVYANSNGSNDVSGWATAWSHGVRDNGNGTYTLWGSPSNADIFYLDFPIESILMYTTINMTWKDNSFAGGLTIPRILITDYDSQETPSWGGQASNPTAFWNNYYILNGITNNKFYNGDTYNAYDANGSNTTFVWNLIEGTKTYYNPSFSILQVNAPGYGAGRNVYNLSGIGNGWGGIILPLSKPVTTAVVSPFNNVVDPDNTARISDATVANGSKLVTKFATALVGDGPKAWGTDLTRYSVFYRPTEIGGLATTVTDDILVTDSLTNTLDGSGIYTQSNLVQEISGLDYDTEYIVSIHARQLTAIFSEAFEFTAGTTTESDSDTLQVSNGEASLYASGAGTLTSYTQPVAGCDNISDPVSTLDDDLNKVSITWTDGVAYGNCELLRIEVRLEGLDGNIAADEDGNAMVPLNVDPGVGYAETTTFSRGFNYQWSIRSVWADNDSIYVNSTTATQAQKNITGYSYNPDPYIVAIDGVAADPPNLLHVWNAETPNTTGISNNVLRVYAETNGSKIKELVIVFVPEVTGNQTAAMNILRVSGEANVDALPSSADYTVDADTFVNDVATFTADITVPYNTSYALIVVENREGNSAGYATDGTNL